MVIVFVLASCLNSMLLLSPPKKQKFRKGSHINRIFQEPDNWNSSVSIEHKKEHLIREREQRGGLVLFGRGLVLCFRPRLRAHLIYYFRSKTTSFAFFNSVFLIRVFTKKKILVTAAIILYWYRWHIWRRRRLNDFLWPGNTKLTVINLVLVKTSFPQNFVADERRTACVTCHGQIRTRSMTKKKNSYSSSFSFSDLKLPNRTW